MAGKTWIKVRRGILEPKHRVQLGPAWYLYLYILDRANWSTGKIFEWTDEGAAVELELPTVTLRSHRRRLEDEGYITTIQRHQRQEITIKKWSDPRNTADSANDGDNHGVKNLTPQTVNGDSHGDSHGNQNLTPLHRINITHNTLEQEKYSVNHYSSIIGLEDTPKSLSVQSEWERSLRLMYDSGATDEMLLRAYVERGTPDPYQLIPVVSRMIKEMV